VPREPTQQEFLPIGHAALDVHAPESDAALGLPAPGNIWIHNLYVSYALQAGGLGAATMDQIETIAMQEPYNARYMVLDTASKTWNLRPDVQKLVHAYEGIPPPRVSHDDDL
jgi:hypothetical protein